MSVKSSAPSLSSIRDHSLHLLPLSQLGCYFLVFLNQVELIIIVRFFKNKNCLHWLAHVGAPVLHL